MSMTQESHTHPVDPARLQSGRWCHREQKTLGQGDICTSYSADRIGTGQPVRRPFSWKSSLWVCVAMTHRNDAVAASAYRLVLPRNFTGQPASYAEKVANAEAARADLNGFYHGMTVKHAGADWVLCGPSVLFVPGESAQLCLF